MSSFNSSASKYQAENTVNKLFSNILHTPLSKGATSTSSTNQLFAQLGGRAVSKKKKKREAAKIKKSEEQSKAFRKFVKYTHVKNKAEKSEADQKYLGRLVRRNVSALERGAKIDDFEVDEEFRAVSAELLDELKSKRGKRLRKKMAFRVKDDDRKKEFDEKIQKGVISYPGLTPGLAPVDYNESDSE
ncbi:Regulator of rDNA transcription 14 [Candida viswanathii]|uniref:Regulator of rDNA transcription 14 n=1 Tax=Candida viswanathii TaxID=5486 RepID=A0A367YMW7_9ASCO|nr:Regulator of rDNA transcription 14 [Candida viswanathii]